MLVAFGGGYRWTYVPAIAVLVMAAVLTRPPVARRGALLLDFSLICCLAWGLLQVVPLPAGWRESLSPQTVAIDRAIRFGGVGPRTLSLDPAGTVNALLVAAMNVAMFWVARHVCGRHGTRTIVRAVAWTGLAMSVIAILVVTSSPSLIYGIWFPHERARPYGPFVNRNHMGTWLLMALLLVTGYVFARFQNRAKVATLAAAVDTKMIWLIGSATAILVAIIVSLSRSASVGTLAGATFLAAMAARHGGRARVGILAGAAVAFAIVMTNPRTVDLGRRFERSGTNATWSRLQIWRETVPILQDFPLTGTGFGSYRTAMLVYQQSDRSLFFNQAHNQYLQLAAEGGLVLLIPLAMACCILATRAVRRLAQDRTPMFWIRTGAVAGIIGALVQSLWETGLRMPANGLLFAALAAIAIHEEHEEMRVRPPFPRR
jgi:O-antigen ligase